MKLRSLDAREDRSPFKTTLLTSKQLLDYFGKVFCITISKLFYCNYDNKNGVLILGGDRVVVCGGYKCEEAMCQGVTNMCYSLETNGQQGGETWLPFANMSIYRWNHLLTEQPLVASQENGVDADSNPHLIAMGYMAQSEYYDEESESFLPYQSSPGLNWLTVNCLTEFEGEIFNMGRTLEVLDPMEWEVREELEQVPQPLYSPGRCCGTNIGGESGIFTRKGFFYNLDQGEFQAVRDTTCRPYLNTVSNSIEFSLCIHPQVSAPPHLPVTQAVNSLYSYGGVPHLFGSPVCTASPDVSCSNSLILAYNPDRDLWDPVGEMLLPRRDHTVIEVPAEFCQRLGLEAPTTTTTTTQDTTTTTTLSTSEDDQVTTDKARSTAPSAVLIGILTYLALRH